MHYEMFLIIQLVHLNCRKGYVQPDEKEDDICLEEQVMVIQG